MMTPLSLHKSGTSSRAWSAFFYFKIKILEFNLNSEKCKISNQKKRGEEGSVLGV